MRYDKIDSVFRERNICEELSGHPNIVRFEATFQDEDNLYFLLEYVERGDLSSMLKAERRLPLELVKFYAAELLLALEYVHSKNIVHRDLKPDNILISADYHVKLTDFGEAKKFDCSDEMVDTPLEEGEDDE